VASKAGSGGKGGASSSEPAPVRLSQPGTPPQPYWGGAPSYPILPPAPLLRPGSPAPNERWLDTEFYNAAGEGFNKYDPTDWLATLKFEMTSFMFPPWAIITGGCLLGTAYIELIAPEHRDWVSAPLDAHTIMGAALSFLVVMRTDASMNRWWDARSAWAAIGNCCLSIGATVAPSLRDEAATEQLLMQLMAFAVSLKCYLRDEKIQLEEVGSRMDAALIRKLNASVCPPLQALRAIMETTKANLPDAGPPSPDKRGGAASLASAVFDEVSEQVRQIQQFVGTCRKIKTTPMTLGYVTTVRSIMLLWLATLPVALIGEFGWLAPPIIGFVAFLFLNVEQMAIEVRARPPRARTHHRRCASTPECSHCPPKPPPPKPPPKPPPQPPSAAPPHPTQPRTPPPTRAPLPTLPYSAARASLYASCIRLRLADRAAVWRRCQRPTAGELHHRARGDAARDGAGQRARGRARRRPARRCGGRRGRRRVHQQVPHVG
jgi:putative membrane protein